MVVTPARSPKSRKSRRAPAARALPLLGGPEFTIYEKFEGTKVQFVEVRTTDFINGFKTEGMEVTNPYGPNVVPEALEVKALCCGPCANIEVALGNRSLSHDPSALATAWRNTCTRVRLVCNGNQARINWPADVKGKSLSDMLTKFTGIVFRICGCKDTAVEIYGRLMYRNVGGCTLLGGVPSVIPNGSTNGSTEALSRYPITIENVAPRSVSSWMDLYNNYVEDYQVLIVPAPTNESEAETKLKELVSRFRINKDEFPSGASNDKVSWLDGGGGDRKLSKHIQETRD